MTEFYIDIQNFKTHLNSFLIILAFEIFKTYNSQLLTQNSKLISKLNKNESGSILGEINYNFMKIYKNDQPNHYSPIHYFNLLKIGLRCIPNGSWKILWIFLKKLFFSIWYVVHRHNTGNIILLGVKIVCKWNN